MRVRPAFVTGQPVTVIPPIEAQRVRHHALRVHLAGAVVLGVVGGDNRPTLGHLVRGEPVITQFEQDGVAGALLMQFLGDLLTVLGEQTVQRQGVLAAGPVHGPHHLDAPVRVRLRHGPEDQSFLLMVPESLRGMVEMPALGRRHQRFHGVRIVVVLGDDRGLFQGQERVPVHRLHGPFRLADLDGGVHDSRLGSGAPGDLLGGNAQQCELLHCAHPIRLGELLTAFVLVELPDDALRLVVVLVAGHDHRHRGLLGLDRGQGAAVPVADPVLPVPGPDRGDRLQHADIADRVDELRVGPRVAADVHVDEQGAGVDVQQFRHFGFPSEKWAVEMIVDNGSVLAHFKENACPDGRFAPNMASRDRGITRSRVSEQHGLGHSQPLERVALGGVPPAAALAHEHDGDPPISHEHHSGDLP